MIKKEIGSEFWDVPYLETQNIIFPDNTNWFISGRSALQAIIAENSFKTASVPDWCCDSMILPFLRSGVSVSFYDALNPPDRFETDAILVMDYFGYSTDKSFNGYKGTVIRDITHSLFSKKYDDADYCFGSLRKWTGFLTGGFAWGFNSPVKYDTDGAEYKKIRQKAMEDKFLYLSGKIGSKDYLNTFSEAEDIIENIGIAPSCERDVELAGKLDVAFIKETRRKNAQVLLNDFSDVAIFPEIKPDDCPMFVPIRVKDRDGLRKWLIQNEIYCPVHWPISKYHVISDRTRRLYDEELSLVCDQRYNEKDMQRIIDTIKSYERG